MIALQWKLDFQSGRAGTVTKFLVLEMKGRRCIETRHNAPVLDSETLESEQKNEETREISYNANTVRANDALSIVIPDIEEFIYAKSVNDGL